MSAITKRQQARNERALQDLTKTVSGNDRCADCGTKNPTWASWNLGVFLCMRCAALHRKLGTHISKVKSLSMDSWTTEQVDNMRSNGNAVSNHRLNPSKTMPQIPIDVDEADGAIERFIRMKYEQGAFMPGSKGARHDTGSTGTGGDEPPPLPPKPTKRLGFSLRSSSANVSKGKITSGYTVQDTRKPGQLFGMKITSIGNNFEQKLVMLREMGFPDNKQNTDILKKADGDLNQAVEVLTRLAPYTASPLAQSPAESPGLTVEKTRTRSDNPWEVKTAQRSMTAPLPQPPRSQSTGPVLSSRNPFLGLETSFSGMSLTAQNSPTVAYTASPMRQQLTGSTNPFLQSASPQVFSANNPWSQGQASTPGTPHSNPFGLPDDERPLPAPPVAAFASDLAINAQSQPTLNAWPPQLQPPTSQYNNALYASQQTSPFSPQVLQAQTTSSFAQPYVSQQNSPFATQSPAQQSSLFISQNPGLPETVGQQNSPFANHNSGAQHMNQQSSGQQYTGQQSSPFAPASHSLNPFPTLAPTANVQSAQITAPALQPQMPQFFQQPAYQQTSIVSQQQLTSPQQSGITSQQQLYNPQLPQQTSIAPQQQLYNHQIPQQSIGLPYTQQPFRHDKSSILALYSQPSFAPSSTMQSLPEEGVVNLTAPQMTTAQSVAGAQQQFASISSHTSKESVDFRGFTKDGRHSPDAFAGLSSRYAR